MEKDYPSVVRCHGRNRVIEANDLTECCSIPRHDLTECCSIPRQSTSDTIKSVMLLGSLDFALHKLSEQQTLMICILIKKYFTS